MKKSLNFIACVLSLTMSMASFAGKGAQDVKLLSGGYVRSTPPEQTVTAAFFELENKGNDPHAITAVESTIAPKVEMHRTVTEVKNMMQMKPVKKFEIGAHQTLSLHPGGEHIMLMDLVKPLAVGDKVKLVLTFEDGSQLPVKLLVKDARD